MIGSDRRWPLQLFRGVSLAVPPAAAWWVAFRSLEPSELDRAVTYALGPLWLGMMGALAVRVGDALLTRVRRAEAPSWLDAVDLLTATGSATSWLGAGAVIGAAWLGWASLSVVGLFGLVAVQLVALWTLFSVGGTSDPWRRASLTRRFVPASVVEGDRVVEEVSLSDVRIPAGFRLFAKGRVGARWPTTRYALGSVESKGEVRLESEIGPAFRGDHAAEPLSVWLQDVLGLCHSVVVRAGRARLVVLPRPRQVDGTRRQLGQGGHDDVPREARRLPTGGSMRLREYQPGDDARRIHWLRSLTAGQIVVRLPDELPLDQPSVRLVLDTFLPDCWDPTLVDRRATTRASHTVESLTCDAPDELMDALVAVWLGVGRALVDAGCRVTLVTARAEGDAVVPLRQALSLRAASPAERLGAQLRWQEHLRPEALVAPFDRDPGGDGRTVVVSHRLPASPKEGEARWIVVPASIWAPVRDAKSPASAGLFSYPMGSADNRWSRRRRERARVERAKTDHAIFSVLCSHSHERRVGNFVARPQGDAKVTLEALQ